MSAGFANIVRDALRDAHRSREAMLVMLPTSGSLKDVLSELGNKFMESSEVPRQIVGIVENVGFDAQ